MATTAPNSFADPYWTDLAASTERLLGLPDGLLVSVLTKGERSNADQVSEAGARTPFQIIPSTRKAAIEKYGIDPYLSPQNAAEVAGNLLKDSLDRNSGSQALAVAEYHGGTDRANWGPRTKAYVKRVVGISPDHPNAAKAAQSGAVALPDPSGQQSTYDRLRAQQQAATPAPSAIAQVFQAYQSGQMTSDEVKQFENDVNAGHVLLPRGAALNSSAKSGTAPGQAAASSNVLPAGVVDAYANGLLSAEEQKQLEADLKDGTVKLPLGMALPKPPNLIDRVGEAITGTKRRTPETDAAPDWASMPELNSFSIAGMKTGLGTLLANPAETVQVIQHNFPGVQVSQDQNGNYLLQSSIDGKQYAIKPGFQVSDIPRAGAAIAAFTPAGRAMTIPGAAAGAAATQTAIEGSQTATGGSFDPGDVAIAGVTGGAIPAIGSALRAATAPVRTLFQRLRGTQDPVADAVGAGAPAPGAAPGPSAPPPVAPAASVATAPVDMMAAPLPSAELSQTAKKAAQGGMGSTRATEVLASQASPNPKVVAAAKRLGIDEYLQPDHVTTNQAYRELAQAVKSMPGSEARAAELAGLERVAKRADDLVEEIGGSHDASAVSADVKTALQRTHGQIKARASALYGEVRAAVPAKAEAPAPTVLDMIAARADELGGMKNLSTMERMINAKLSPKVRKAVPGEEAQAPRQPTYALLDDVRRDLTAAKYSRQGPFKDSDDRLITMLEGALRKDQQAAAERFGMGETWDLAQKAAASYKGIQDDLSAIFGKNLDESIVGKLTGAIKLLPAGDTSKFLRLVRSVPEEMRQEVVASGLNTAFGKSAQRGTLNFNSYANWYEGLLRNKQAHAAVMSNLPAPARKQLSDLYRTASAISAATKERITTGRINAVTDELKGADGLVARLYDTAKRSSAGLAAEAVTTPLGIPGAGVAAGIASAFTKGAKPSAIKAVDELIASPAFIALAKQGTQAPTRGGKLRLVHSEVFKRFARAVGHSHDPSVAEKWVTQAMQNNNQQQR